MTFKEWQELATTLHARSDRVRNSVVRRARELSKEAGLDPNLLGIHPHNAWCAFQSGRPWPEVNYAKVRKIRWLLQEKEFEASNIVDRILKRAWDTVKFGS